MIFIDGYDAHAVYMIQISLGSLLRIIMILMLHENLLPIPNLKGNLPIACSGKPNLAKGRAT